MNAPQAAAYKGKAHVDAPVLDAAAMRGAGRVLDPPFRVVLASGRMLLIRRVLRVLPGKRIVGESELGGHRLLAKLFIDGNSARHWARERDGITTLTRAGIPTPSVVAAEPLAGEGHALLTRFLDGASTVLDAWGPISAEEPGNAAGLALLTPVFALLGGAHAAGLSHVDLHLGNFLCQGNLVHLIDGDAIRVFGQSRLPEKAAAAGLAMLLAQLPCSWEDHFAPLLTAYRTGNPHPPSLTALTCALRTQRTRRLKDYLGKIGRDCSLVAVSRSVDRFVAAVRSEARELQPLLADPDAWMARGEMLKHGNTSTVVCVEINGRALVVKRYNIKNAVHGLLRLWRPSRAWHAWREGHRLRLLGIPTPVPLALIEERIGPLRRRAWLITEHCPGQDLLEHLALDAEEGPPPCEAEALRRLFLTLHRQRISHGDLKATNLLWHQQAVVVIDLDAMRQHCSDAAYAAAWRRDRARLQRNWPANSALWHRLGEILPPA